MNTTYDKTVSTTIFRLTCLFSTVLAAVSWVYEIVLYDSDPLLMAAQGVLLILLAAAVTWPFRNGATFARIWLRAYRFTHWTLLTAPIFLMIWFALLQPIQLPQNAEQWMWQLKAWRDIYVILLLILWILKKNTFDPMTGRERDYIVRCLSGREKDCPELLKRIAAWKGKDAK